MPSVRFFKDSAAWRKWLETNHESKTELWVGFYNKQSGKRGLGYKEAVDEALCFGWIDGIKKNVDEISYTNRFTPRKKKSTWSNINSKRVKELIAEGRMMPAGIKAFNERDEKRSGIYSFEQESKKLLPAYEKRFRADKKAWNFFSSQPPWYQRTAIHLIMNAKQETTRIRRLESLIFYSAQEKTIPQLTRTQPKK